VLLVFDNRVAYPKTEPSDRARLLAGEDDEVKQIHLKAGTLNVFKGKNTAHRVTAVEGDRERIIAVLSFYERPNVRFCEEDQLKSYGRIAV